MQGDESIDGHLESQGPTGGSTEQMGPMGSVRYPKAYLAFVAFASLDIVMTWLILARNGIEVNPLARHVIAEWGLPGAILFKFSLVLFVVIVCEEVGRQKDRTGRWLAAAAVVISAVPVFYSVGLLAHRYLMIGREEVLSPES